MTVENECELSVMKHDIKYLKKIAQKRCRDAEQKLKADSEIAWLRLQLTLTKFCLDRFKHNEAHFKCYTRFETYEMFNVFYTFLQPGANVLIYWDPVTNIYYTTEPSKYGGARLLQPQEELFVTLVWLCCWLPIEKFSVRFNIITSTISWIIITWITFFHSKLRTLPIWNQRKQLINLCQKLSRNCIPQQGVL